MAPLCYRRYRFPPEIFQHAIWLYLRFTLSYRDVEELLAERGLDISYETVRRWVLKFGPAIARRLRLQLLSGNECPRDQAGRARQSPGAATLPARIGLCKGSVSFHIRSLSGKIEGGDPVFLARFVKRGWGRALTDPGCMA